MENYKRIVLKDKEVTDGMHKMTCFITRFTHIPFTGETFKEWQEYVKLNLPYAEAEKAKENAARLAHTGVVPKETVKNHGSGKHVKIDVDKLYAAIERTGFTNTQISEMCGRSHSYLSGLKPKGWAYESFIAKLSDVGIDAADYVTDEWYRKKYLSDGEPIREAPKQVTVLPRAVTLNEITNEHAVTLSAEEENAAAFLASMGKQSVDGYITDIVKSAIRSQLEAIKRILAVRGKQA